MNFTRAISSILILLFSSYTFSNTRCIAHRGNNIDHFENSFDALYSAIDVGSHGVEFDIVHTKDNKAIVLHDKKLKRLAKNKDGKVCPLKSKIRKLNIADIRENCLLKNNEEIPTLEEFLTILETKNILRFIEFKDRPSKRTFKLIEKYSKNNPNLLRIISFKKSYLKKVYKLKRKSSFWKNVGLLALYRTPIRNSKKYGVNFSKNALSQLSFIKRRNREIGVWTVDSLHTMNKIKDKKIDFITTNNPRKCLSVYN